jgi:hypothetical protein
MKQLFFLLVIILGTSCVKEKRTQDQMLTDNDWHDFLSKSLALANVNKPFIFKEYGNIELMEITSSLYTNCEDLGYKINDSILANIHKRINKPITNNLDTMFSASFVSDTNKLGYDFVVFSEPFHVNSEMLLITMLKKDVKENKIYQWGFFLKRQNGSMKIITFYNAQKDLFYDPIPLK